MDYKFINTEYLSTVSGGDAEIMGEIVLMFKDQSVEIYNEMKSSLAVNNFAMIASLAHKAKSSVLIMGMNDLADVLKTLELQAREGQESELYQSSVERFKADTEAAVKELEDLVKNKQKST
jgi:HPt (histidine-containing phosphotransfer) domain-containing protein